MVTADNSLSAHAEHTIAVTENGPEILTLTKDQKREISGTKSENAVA